MRVELQTLGRRKALIDWFRPQTPSVSPHIFGPLGEMRMAASLQANFMNNTLSLRSMALRSSLSGRSGFAVKVGQNGRSGDPNVVVLTESTKSGSEAVVAPLAADLNVKLAVATGGVQDVYGEDSARGPIRHSLGHQRR